MTGGGCRSSGAGQLGLDAQRWLRLSQRLRLQRLRLNRGAIQPLPPGIALRFGRSELAPKPLNAAHAMAMDPLSEQLIHPMRILCAKGSLQSQLLRLAASLG